jgi:hypothetical protein
LYLFNCNEIKKALQALPIPGGERLAHKTAIIVVPPTGLAGTNDQANIIPAPVGVGFTVSPRTGILVSENGTSSSFTIQLNTKPSADVIINFLNPNSSEISISTTTLTFTDSNWNIPQTITITGVDDTLTDGNQLINLDLGFSSSTDSTYHNLPLGIVEIINSDNDSSGLTISPSTGLVVNESGNTATFQVVLNTIPTGTVTIPLQSSDTTEGTVSPSSLVFTPANWNLPQTVTITGVNDFLLDGTIHFTIELLSSTSSDSSYSGLTGIVNVQNNDNDIPDFTITNTTLTTSENGTTANFFVVLNTIPSHDVTLPLTISNPSEGSLSTSSLVFTPLSWNLTQTITVTGLNDFIADGNITYSIQVGAPSSADTNYSSLSPKSVTVTNNDNDTPGFDITTISGNTSEDGTTAFFRVRLFTSPTADVTVNFTSSLISEGVIQSGSSLIFNSTNWNNYQTVTIRGINDSVADGDRNFTILSSAATSTDTNYSGLDPVDVNLVNEDNDSPGYTVSFNGTEPLPTSESGATARFTVKLRTKPTANVVFTGITSSNHLAGTVSPSTLTFTNTNWSIPQVVTVTGVNNDYLNPSGLPYSVTIPSPTSADSNYTGLLSRVLNLINNDNDTRGYTFSKTRNFITSELGNTDSFTLRLNTQPVGGNVVIPIASSNASEVTVSPASLVFTPANWNVPQTVTLTGVSDGINDGTQSVNILLGTASSGSGFRNYFPNATGSDYDSVQITDYNSNGVNNGIFTLNNCDVSQKIAVCMPIASERVTSESGGSFQYYVLLDSAPSGNVSFPVSVTDTAEGVVSTTTITKTPANWNTVQLITVTGLNDLALEASGQQVDGNKLYNVTHGISTSTDLSFSGIDVIDITNITNTDNDSPNIILIPANSNNSRITLINGSTMNLSLRLNSQPTADVTFNLSGAGFTVSPSPNFTFTSANWNVDQTVTVNYTGALGNRTLSSSNFVSADPKFSGRTTNDVFYNIVQAGFTVSAISGDTDETGTSRTFTVRLNAPPTSTVTVSLNSTNTNEVIITSTPTLVFTPANWNTNQTVTVQGVDDLDLDGDQTATINLAPAVSLDASYNGLDPANVNVLNIDND